MKLVILVNLEIMVKIVNSVTLLILVIVMTLVILLNLVNLVILKSLMGQANLGILVNLVNLANLVIRVSLVIMISLAILVNLVSPYLMILGNLEYGDSGDSSDFGDYDVSGGLAHNYVLQSPSARNKCSVDFLVCMILRALISFSVTDGNRVYKDFGVYFWYGKLCLFQNMQIVVVVSWCSDTASFLRPIGFKFRFFR